MRQAEMPYGVTLVPHKIKLPRVVIKNRRSYGNVRNIVAEWPRAGLHELGKYALVCVLDGYVDYQLGNCKVKCGAGKFIFIPPGIPRPDGSKTYVDLEKSTFCDIATFLLHPNALDCWTSHTTAEGRKQSNDCFILHERAVSLFHALMEEVINEEASESRIGEELLSVFFAILQREINAGQFHPIRSSRQLAMQVMSAPPKDFLTHLERFVGDNLRKSLTLNVVSAEMYFSPAQFARVMRRETGKSFNEYLAARRMEEAKKLLRDSQWTIAVIASLVGFKSPDYFRTFFKRYTGMTPSEFRLRKNEHITK